MKNKEFKLIEGKKVSELEDEDIEVEEDFLNFEQKVLRRSIIRKYSHKNPYS